MASSNKSGKDERELTRALSSKSKSTSGSTGKTTSSYGDNYFGFGSKEAYAGAIKSKLASGQKLSNPEAAEQFKKENPGLFKDEKDERELTRALSQQNKTASSSPSKSTSTKSSSTSTTGTATSGYGDNYFGFGSKEAYANAIKERLASGQALSNPEDAARFIAENPRLFEDTSGVTGGTASSSGITLSGGDERELTRALSQQNRMSEILGPSTPPPQPVVDLTPTPPRYQPSPSKPSVPTTPPPQTIGTPPTNIEVPEGTAPETAPTAARREAMARGPYGFAEQMTPIGNVPTPDELYNIYKGVTGGQENPAVRDYLASEQFQTVLGGTIPLWMQTDPVWRLYLKRLGYNIGSRNTARVQAIQDRLQGGS